MLAVGHVGQSTTPIAKSGKPRARRTLHPELDGLRQALSVTNKTPAWKRWGAKLRFFCSYAVVPGTLPDSPCYHWIGTTSDEGYGRFTVQKRTGPAHRYALTDIEGVSLPRKPYVYHNCGDTACVNPDHLSFSKVPERWPDGVVAPRIGDYDLMPADVERFERKVGDDPSMTCRLWMGTVNCSTAYGKISLGGKWVDVHRVAHAIANGSVPKGFYVCHGPECEALPGMVGRRCVNPDHLIADTHAANMADKNGGHLRRTFSQMPITMGVREAAQALHDLSGLE